MKRLLLIGGGHSHVEVIRRFRAAPPAGVEVSLVSADRYTPYSGMLTGLIAGHYSFHDCHIDLEQLCESARVAFVCARVNSLDPERGDARWAGGEARFDWLSLDVGSTPATSGVPGAAEHTVRVKPVSALLDAWSRLLAEARAAPRRVVVVGGGAGGVELAFAIHHRLVAGAVPGSRVSVVTDTPTILPGHPAAVRCVFERLAVERGITLCCASRVVKVTPRTIHLEHGALPEADCVVWATAAASAGWISASGLATDARGFVAVDDTLRSVSHQRVFAAGDCASMVDHVVAKSGVYAVRQGPVLANNIRHALEGRPLTRYRPQRVALALISAGDQYAVASWNGMSLRGAWVWRWKDRIDRRFMAMYRAAAAQD